MPLSSVALLPGVIALRLLHGRTLRLPRHAPHAPLLRRLNMDNNVIGPQGKAALRQACQERMVPPPAGRKRHKDVHKGQRKGIALTIEIGMIK